MPIPDSSPPHSIVLPQFSHSDSEVIEPGYRTRQGEDRRDLQSPALLQVCDFTQWVEVLWLNWG